MHELSIAFDICRITEEHVGASDLGRVVEVASGQSLDRFIEERIFEPVGMDDTFFTVPEKKLPRLAEMYVPNGAGGLKPAGALRSYRFVNPSNRFFSGGGGLLSTAADYYRFTAMLRGGGALDEVRLLSRKTVQHMTLNQLPGDLAEMGEASFNETSFEGIGFGLGFSVLLDPAKANVLGSVGEFAWGGMASTAFWIDPVEDITVIFLTQLSPSSTYPLRRELRVLANQAIID